jgi:hypothetical protein
MKAKPRAINADLLDKAYFTVDGTVLINNLEASSLTLVPRCAPTSKKTVPQSDWA